LPRLVKKTGAGLGEELTTKGHASSGEKAYHFIKLPQNSTARKRTKSALKLLINQTFGQEGLVGRLAIPAMRGQACTEGITNELVVRFKSFVSEQQAYSIAKKLSATVLRKIKYLGNAYLWRYADIPSYKVLDLVDHLLNNFPVQYAEPNILYQIENDDYIPNDYLYPAQPHLEVINADAAWDTLDDISVDLRAGSPDITIAVFDSHG
jgi:hypothetical protein